ncbi:MAG: hypothetical protein ACREXR_16590, partial [Gammaproteobacteria bacterium]
LYIAPRRRFSDTANIASSYWHRVWSREYNPRSLRGVRMQTATETASPQVHTSQPSGTDRCFILSGVSWETYERLLADMQDNHAARFASEQLKRPVWLRQVRARARSSF